MKRILLILLFAAVLMQAAGYEPLRRRVYLFGFAASFTDSVSYVTDIQTLDSAYVHYNGFLDSRGLYALQLEQHLAATNREGLTCMVFFHKNKRKLEKRFLKVKKKYMATHAAAIAPIGRDEFQFRLEPWVDSQIEEPSLQPQPQRKSKSSAVKPMQEQSVATGTTGRGGLEQE